MIYCECCNDEVLLKALGKVRKQIKHCPNKFEVCKSLKKDSNSIGLIDEDPGKLQDKYADSMEVIFNQDGIIVKEDHINGNKIILVCSELEPWIENAIAISGIDKSRYYLPENLHDIGTNDKKLDKLKQLLIDMLPISAMLKTLKSHL